MKYPFTFYVKTLPLNFGGCANAFVIRILDKYRADEGLYNHELTHIKQWLVLFQVGLAFAVIQYHLVGDALVSFAFAAAGFSLHGLLYKFNHSYRLHCEVEAYRVQAGYYKDDRRSLFAGFIANYYGLNVTQQEAENLLRKS